MSAGRSRRDGRPIPRSDRRTGGSRGSGPEPSAGSPRTAAPRPGETAHAAGRTLTSWHVAALPILDHLLRRLRLRDFLREHLPREDRRCRVATATGLLVLLQNLLISREPLYGVGEWAARHVPGLLGLTPEQLPALNDDRVGRCLDRLFDADIPSLTLAVVTPRGPRVRRRARRTAQRLDDHHLPRRLRGCGPRADLARAAPPGGHLRAQQGPPPRPEATALHPHRHPRRRRAGAVPRRERQRHR